MLWFAFSVAALIAIGLGLDRWSRYIDRRDKESWSEPNLFTVSDALYRGEICSDQEPIALEDTPVGAPHHGTKPSEGLSREDIRKLANAIKPRYKLCPVCKHRNKQKGCKSILKTERTHKKPLRCNCSYEFHSGSKAKKKRAA